MGNCFSTLSIRQSISRTFEAHHQSSLKLMIKMTIIILFMVIPLSTKVLAAVASDVTGRPQTLMKNIAIVIAMDGKLYAMEKRLPDNEYDLC